jgi:hypothetical protein
MPYCNCFLQSSLLKHVGLMQAAANVIQKESMSE